jgi:hypothetical protein
MWKSITEKQKDGTWMAVGFSHEGKHIWDKASWSKEKGWWIVSGGSLLKEDVLFYFSFPPFPSKEEPKMPKPEFTLEEITAE